jgi:aminopeptidase
VSTRRIDPSLPAAALDTAERNLRSVLSLAIGYSSAESALVIWDGGCDLALALTEAYRRCLPGARFLEFDGAAPAIVLAAIESLAARDLVVLIQSTSFRLDTFRIRLELFRRSLKVIEHPHLARMPGAEGALYIDSLAYDRDYYRGVGHALKACIDRAQTAVIDSGGERLVFAGGLEPAKLNIGDYGGMKNVGGQYPIGEVFTESRNLEAVNGRVRLALFAATDYTVDRPEQPITLVVDRGRVTRAIGSTPEFDRVLAGIRSDEGEVWMREFGFGMNRAFSLERTVSDVGTLERMCGVHLSLGAKHATFEKVHIKKRRARHHVDVFVLTSFVTVNEEIVFQDGAWRVLPLALAGPA